MNIMNPICGCMLCQHALGDCTIKFESNSFRILLSAGLDRGHQTSRLPTWVVNFGVGFCWMRVCVGSPLVTKFLCGQVVFCWIAHAAAECIAASLFSRKDVSTAMFTDPVQPLHCHHRHHSQSQCTVHVLNHKLSNNFSYCVIIIIVVYWLF